MRYTHDLDGSGKPEWLRIVHAVNGIIPGTFGEPVSSGPWWAGGVCEDYPTARIIFRTDGSVSIVAMPNTETMDAVRAALRQAHLAVCGVELPASRW